MNKEIKEEIRTALSKKDDFYTNNCTLTIDIKKVRGKIKVSVNEALHAKHTYIDANCKINKGDKAINLDFEYLRIPEISKKRLITKIANYIASRVK